MNRILHYTVKCTIAVFLTVSVALGQTGSIKGTVLDEETSEAVVGANVVMKGTTTGTITDVNGNFLLEGVSAGPGVMTVSFVGYTPKEIEVTVAPGKSVNLGRVKMTSQSFGLEEVSIMASVAVDRKTPVAVTTIKGATIEEKLGNQEFPEMLRSTPSIYVTKQGGGFGDARINVRGFDSRNTAVMINGVPVNDMENGWVYWSNWAGLSDVTSSLQVQRGLGASKLAVSSVGGSINILTNAAEMKKGGSASLGVGNDGFFKFGAVYSTGLSEKGWAFTLQATHTRGDGYANGTMFRAYSYFASVAKNINEKHSLHLTAIGAPQWHNQRNFASSILDYEKYGIRYNSSWGTLDGEEFSMAKNFYHKPKIFLNHYWTIGSKTELATSAYASFGRGGGTGDLGRINGASVFSLPKTADGLIRFDDLKRWNQGGTVTDFGADNVPYPTGPFAGQYVGQSGSNGIIRRASMNEHNWYGVLSNITHEISDRFTFVGGIDVRYYKGLHYRRVEDKLGLDAYLDEANRNDPERFITDEGRSDGNAIAYNNDGLVNWIGVFSQLEYSWNKLSAFVSGSVSNQGFKRVDYFLYTPDDENPGKETGWQNFKGGTVKGGLNYNLTQHHNVFVNGGYFSQQPIFDVVFVSNTNRIREGVENQHVYALELGYGYRNQFVSANLNLYQTRWDNRQFSRSYTDISGTGTANFTGVNQLHQGIELDVKASPLAKLTINGMASIGNWRYTDNFSGDRFDQNNVFLDTRTLYMKDVKVPDAAQTTFSIGADYEVIRNLSIYASYYYADKIFADFNITSDRTFDAPPAAGEDANQAWELPAYSLVDAGLSYKFNVGGLDITWRFNLNNVLDEEYIAESDTNIVYDPEHANDREIGENGSVSNRVYYGFGRTWNTSVKIRF